MASQPTDELFDDRWRRSATDFAVRFPLRVSNGIVKHGIQVDEGTRAFLYVNGKSDGFLKPGYHVKSSLMERLTKLERYSEHSFAILVSTGPAMVSFPIAGLHDSEQIPLGALVKLELELKDPDKFNERAMAGRESFGSNDLAALVGEEVKDAVQKQAAGYRVEDLLTDTSQRESLETLLAMEMPRILEPYGVKFSSVRLARFTGEEVEAIRTRMGDKAVKARQWELDRELQVMERENSFSAIYTEYEYNEREKQLAADYSLKDDERELFRTRWQAQTGHELRLEDIDRNKVERLTHQDAERDVRTGEKRDELGEVDHKIAKAGKEGNLDKVVAQSEVDVDIIKTEGGAKVSDIEHSQMTREDLRDLDTADEARRRALESIRLKNEIEIEREAAESRRRMDEEDRRARREAEALDSKARAMAGRSKEELIAITGRADLADRYVRLEQVQRGQEPKFEPGPHNHEFRGLPTQPGQAMPFANPAQSGSPWDGVAMHVPHVMPAPTFSAQRPGSSGSEDEALKDVARRMISAVGLLSVVGEQGGAKSFGTGWLMSSNMLATNAHVAAEAIKAMESGGSCWVTFGGKGTRKTRVKQALLHPRYGQALPSADGSEPAVPAYDVALMVLEDEQPLFFPMAKVEKLARFTADRIGMKVAYLGFPMEGMAGGGVNASNPAALMKPGNVTQVTDWWLGGEVDFPNAQLILHDLGVAGGASGSPLFDADGEVVGIVSAGNMSGGIDAASGTLSRVPSGVMVNFAQRVDLLLDLLVNSEHGDY